MSADRAVGPIVPVEQTSTSVGSHPTMPAHRRSHAGAAVNPGAPVPALAHPELSTTARVDGPAARWLRLSSTGRRRRLVDREDRCRRPFPASPTTSATSRSPAA